MGCGASNSAQSAGSVANGAASSKSTPQNSSAAVASPTQTSKPEQQEQHSPAENSVAASAPASDPSKGGKTLEAACTLVGKGVELVDSAGSSLADVQAVADLSASSALLDTLSGLGLSGHSDVKHALGASWVFVSESAKFFTIGKVAVALLEQIYHMWNAWQNKTVWLGEFIAFLQLVEADLCAGLNVFKHLSALRQLEKQLCVSRDLVSVITHRGRSSSLVFALYDESTLHEQQVAIEARKRECLFGHVVDIKAMSGGNLNSVNRIAQLVRDRQARLESYRNFNGMTPEARGVKMKQLAYEFGVMDMSGRVRSLMDTFARAQRSYLIRSFAGASHLEERYYQSHMTSLMRSPMLDASQAGLEVLDPDQAARELDGFQRLPQELRHAQIEQLRVELSSAVAEAQEMAKAINIDGSSTASPFAATLDQIKQARSVLASLRALSPADAAAVHSASTALSALLDEIRSRQLECGWLLPALPSQAQLLALVPVSDSERALYTSLFERAYASELAHARAWLRMDPAEWAKYGITPKERLLAIRAPAPLEGEAAAAELASVSPAPANSSDAACLTTSIFLAFLSEIVPQSVRAMHFVPHRAEQIRDRAARQARKEQRQMDRAAAIRAAYASKKNGWRERNMQKAKARVEGRGDELSDDESEPMEDPEADAMAEQQASQSETVAETEEAELQLSISDSFSSANLRRSFPSLAFQLSQSLPTYYGNLLAKGAMLSRASLFDKLNSSEFFDQILVTPLLQAGAVQSNPNESASAASCSVGHPAERVCMVLDGAAWSFSHPVGEKDALHSGEADLPFELDEPLRQSMSKQVPRLPAWLGVLLSLPHSTPSFDKRVLADPSHGGKALQLEKHALSDLSNMYEEPVGT